MPKRMRPVVFAQNERFIDDTYPRDRVTHSGLSTQGDFATMLNATKVAFASALVLAAHSASAQVPNVKYLGSLTDVVTCPKSGNITLAPIATLVYVTKGQPWAVGKDVLTLQYPNVLVNGVSVPSSNIDVIYHTHGRRLNVDFLLPPISDKPDIYRTDLTFELQGFDTGVPYVVLKIAYPRPGVGGSPNDCTGREISGVMIATVP